MQKALDRTCFRRDGWHPPQLTVLQKRMRYKTGGVLRTQSKYTGLTERHRTLVTRFFLSTDPALTCLDQVRPVR